MKKDSFKDRFRLLRNQLGLTQDQLVTKFNQKFIYNFNKSSISLYENGKQTPEIDVLEKWADFFNVTVDYLLGRSPSALHESLAEYGQKNKELLDLYYQLNNEGKNKLIEYAQDLINGGRYKKDVSSQKMKNA